MKRYSDIRTDWGFRLKEAGPRNGNQLTHKWIEFSNVAPNWIHSVRNSVLSSPRIGGNSESNILPLDTSIALHEGQQPSFDLSSWSKRATLASIARTMNIPHISVVHDALPINSYPQGVIISTPSGSGNADVSLLPSMISCLSKVKQKETRTLTLPYSARKSMGSNALFCDVSVRDNLKDIVSGLNTMFGLIKSTCSHVSRFNEDKYNEFVRIAQDETDKAAENNWNYSEWIAQLQMKYFACYLDLHLHIAFTSKFFCTSSFQKAVRLALRSCGSVLDTTILINRVITELKGKSIISKSTSVKELQAVEDDRLCEIPARLAGSMAIPLFIKEDSGSCILLLREDNNYHEIGLFDDVDITLFPQSVILGMLMLGSFATGWEWGGGSYIQVVLEVLKRIIGIEPVLFLCSSWLTKNLNVSSCSKTISLKAPVSINPLLAMFLMERSEHDLFCDYDSRTVMWPCSKAEYSF